MGYFISYKNLKPTDEYIEIAVEELYVELLLFDDILSTYYITKTLNEIRNKKLTLEHTIYLEALVWNNLALIDFDYKKYPTKWNEKHQSKLDYIKKYKSTYIKNDPNKAIKTVR